MELQPDRINNIYHQSFRSIKNKKSIETTQTINETLPNISHQSPHTTKANHLRNQLNQEKSQIILMQAKLKNLKNLKEKFQLKNQHNKTKIQFANNIKQRIRQQSQFKQKLNKARQLSAQKLKQQTQQLRQSLIMNRKNAENTLYIAKANQAELERRRRKHHEYLLQKLKQLDMVEKNRKVQKIKELHETSASRIQDFKQSRIYFSRDNYHKKVMSTLQQKQKAQNILKRLKDEEQRLLNDVRNSQKTMLTSLYSLQTLNPERKKNRAKSDRNIKHQAMSNDSYENQQFQK